jgi:hypothetical protein
LDRARYSETSRILTVQTSEILRECESKSENERAREKRKRGSVRESETESKR